jgi:Flp pilus assembly protein TadD
MSGTIEDAMARARRGDLAGARASAEAALVLRPRDPALLRLRAWLLQQLGLLGDAETAYRNLVAAEPADYESWTNLGSTLLLAGDAAAAADALDRAAALREDLVPIQINLAMARAALGDGEGAAEAAAAAVRLAPGDAGLRLEAGRIFGRVGRHAEAVAQIEAAARIAPREPQIRLELGLARAAIGDLEGAEREYRAALALAPGWAPGWLALGTLRESAGVGGSCRRWSRRRWPRARGLAKSNGCGRLRCGGRGGWKRRSLRPRRRRPALTRPSGRS